MCANHNHSVDLQPCLNRTSLAFHQSTYLGGFSWCSTVTCSVYVREVRVFEAALHQCLQCVQKKGTVLCVDILDSLHKVMNIEALPQVSTFSHSYCKGTSHLKKPIRFSNSADLHSITGLPVLLAEADKKQQEEKALLYQASCLSSAECSKAV